MKCPHCNIALVMTDRSGIEIDYCPQCRGVWLDRGELDKIIERAAPAQQPAPVQYAAPAQPQYGGHDGQYKHKQGLGYHKKKSILGELFDF